MSLPDNWMLFLIIGLASGLLSGALGVGAGIVMIPTLVMLSYPQKEAQGMALAVMVPMALVAAVRYKMDPTIGFDMSIVLILAAGAVAGVFFGTSIASALPGGVLRKIFAVFMVIAAVRMFTLKS